MAIKISGTTVVTDTRDITNIIDMTVSGTATFTGPATFSNENVNFSTTEAINLPVGTEAQRPSAPTNGDFRINTDSGYLEYYQESRWKNAGGGLSASGMFLASSFSI